ncbi:MAG: hypothetical protein MJ016_05985 [Victivallaceae bacterium]|nr:hypothetical protein [Victivallaceae bacterium]
MKKEWLLLSMIAVFVSGCATAEKNGNAAAETPAPITEIDDDAVLAGKALAQEYMDGFVAAVRADDFERLKPFLPQDGDARKMRGLFVGQQKWIHEKLGELQNAEFSDVFRQGAVCDCVWKLSFGKSADGKTSVVELPYHVRVAAVDRRMQIVTVGFSFPSK